MCGFCYEQQVQSLSPTRPQLPVKQSTPKNPFQKQVYWQQILTNSDTFAKYHTVKQSK